ncbi:MAG: ATP-binding cassette domain-containing protein [Spirochaetales bacterium]|nr:ATP-binding cassette domain-containing protein [Spirochaetales bacterium]
MLPLLCIDDVSVGYGEKIVIKDFSLTVNKGDHFLLLGPNGSGKTTLFRLILGIIPPMKGKVEYPMGRSVSYARQDPPSSPFPISVEEVVEMGLWKSGREREKTINEALEMTDALHLKKRLFHSLSGGERQRVSLSRCLAQNSPLILLDEPSSFLDRESRDSFISLMEKVATPERAIIAITHDSTVIDRLGWKEVTLERRRDNE